MPKPSRPNPAKLLEKHIVKQVRDYMLHRGWRYVRIHPIVMPGMFSAGEPGQPDALFLYYREHGAALALWIEFKGPNDRRGCRCEPGKICKTCRQKQWHERERARGGRVWVVDDLDWFLGEYEAHYGYLHSGETGRGQLDLLATVKI